MTTYDPQKPLSWNNRPRYGEYEPPIIFDIHLDAWRLARQTDIQQFGAMNAAYGEMVTFLRQRHETLRQQFKDIAADPGGPLELVADDGTVLVWNGDKWVPKT